MRVTKNQNECGGFCVIVLSLFTFNSFLDHSLPLRPLTPQVPQLLLLLLLRFICRPPIKDIVLALAGVFEVLFCLFLHFVLLIYNFLVHIIGFSK